MAQRRKVTPSIIGRMLVDEKAGEKTWEASKIFIYFILKSIDFFIEEILFPVFAGAIFRFCQ